MGRVSMSMSVGSLRSLLRSAPRALSPRAAGSPLVPPDPASGALVSPPRTPFAEEIVLLASSPRTLRVQHARSVPETVLEEGVRGRTWPCSAACQALGACDPVLHAAHPACPHT
eukprot:3323433-Rhodomonas_salina.3